MRRGAVAVLLVGLLTSTACGGSSTSGPAAKRAEVRVTFSPDPLRVGPVTWRVTIVNGTAGALHLTFASGKRADVTLSKGGDVVYQWSRGMLFTQMVGDLDVAPGARETFTLDEAGLEIDPGTYRLAAVVAADGHPDLRATSQVTVRGR